MPQEDRQVNWMGSYEQKNNAYSNHYNLGWINHLNFSWRNNQAAQQPPQQFQPAPAPKPQYVQNRNHNQGQNYQQPKLQHTAAPSHALEDTLQSFIKAVEKTNTNNQRQFEELRGSKQDTDKKIEGMGNAIRRLEMQLGQVAESSTSHRPRKLPSQPKHPRQ